MTTPLIGSTTWQLLMRTAGRRCQCTTCRDHKGRCDRQHSIASPLYPTETGDTWTLLCQPCKTAAAAPPAAPRTTARRKR